jgi:hypothetical protein
MVPVIIVLKQCVTFWLRSIRNNRLTNGKSTVFALPRIVRNTHPIEDVWLQAKTWIRRWVRFSKFFSPAQVAIWVVFAKHDLWFLETPDVRRFFKNKMGFL